MAEYPKPSFTADVAVLLHDEAGDLRMLFIRRKHDPFAGAWALPGGFCEPGETIARAAARELEEETHLTGIALEEVRTFSTPGRDPRGWVVSVLHLAYVPRERAAEARGGDDAEDARWHRVRRGEGGSIQVVDEAGKSLPLAFDHAEMVEAALERHSKREPR